MKTNTQRQRDYKARQRALGRVRREVWTHPEDWPWIKSMINSFNRQRAMNQQREDKADQ